MLTFFLINGTEFIDVFETRIPKLTQKAHDFPDVVGKFCECKITYLALLTSGDVGKLLDFLIPLVLFPISNSPVYCN